MGRTDTLGMLAVAAAAVNSLPALRFLAAKVRHLAHCSELYGAPLLAAASNGSLAATFFLYSHLQGYSRFRFQLIYTIETCMSKLCSDFAVLPWLVY